jgi:hypothetical protein
VGASWIVELVSTGEVPVAAELGEDLLIQPALVVFDRQEQVGALLCGELNNAAEVCRASVWISTPPSSSVLNRAFRAARSWDSPVSFDRRWQAP